MSDREKFPAGSVVKRRSESPVWRGVAGKVLYDAGIDRYVLVQWANRSHPGEEDAGDFTLLTEPPRAPARTLAPGVESRPDVQGGKPCLAGTRTPTDVVRGWADWADFAPHYPHVTEPEYDRAVLVEAGVTAERERRRRRKEKRRCGGTSA